MKEGIKQILEAIEELQENIANGDFCDKCIDSNENCKSSCFVIHKICNDLEKIVSSVSKSEATDV